MSKTLYVVSPLAQKEEVDRYCFKDCGQIIIGGIDILGASFCPCRTEACPYEEKSISLGKAKVFGAWEEIIVRKLKPLQGELPK